MLDLKEDRIRQIETAFEALKKVSNDGLMLIEQFKPVVKKFNPAESAKTLRKLGLFGSTAFAVDFEWPTKD